MTNNPNNPLTEPISPKERMKISRQHMPAQDADVRAGEFTEVNLGLDEHLAIMEARRCLQCKKATCIEGCPVNIDIPAFVQKVSEGDFAGAAGVLYATNMLPAISGRVCPQEKQCEAKCVRLKAADKTAVGIGYLERFVADWASRRYQRPGVEAAKTGKRVAVVGSGPAGLTCAGQLARRGHSVTIFEALHEVGGVLVYGIPEFRLPKQIVRDEVQALKNLGVEIQTNVIIGRSYTIDDLLGDLKFDAIFIANGAGLPVFMDIPGENLKGVYSANEYLTRVNLMCAWEPDGATPVLRAKRVCVIGGGNTAMDAVRTARRLGKELGGTATLVYRRSRVEMPARVEEVVHAEEEGVEFELLVSPIAILGDDNGWVRALKCQRMELGEPNESGRRSPVPIPDSEFEIPCEMVVEAIGTRANPLLTQTTPDLKINSRGNIEVDAHGMTSIPGVFAGGDIVRGAATVILAMGDGKNAARSIDAYLRDH